MSHAQPCCLEVTGVLQQSGHTKVSLAVCTKVVRFRVDGTVFGPLVDVAQGILLLSYQFRCGEFVSEGDRHIGWGSTLLAVLHLDTQILAHCDARSVPSTNYMLCLLQPQTSKHMHLGAVLLVLAKTWSKFKCHSCPQIS